jgi:uncharacterized protein (TIGR02145 family)
MLQRSALHLKDFMKKLLIPGFVILLSSLFCMRNTVTDVDGNQYTIVKIGNQLWTVENLRTTRFNDGSAIPHVTDSNTWHSLKSPGYCYYRNTENSDTIRRLGALYNWYCISSDKLAPPGWRIPTNDDWNALQNFLIEHGYNWDNNRTENRIAKSLAAKKSWRPYDNEGTPGNKMRDNNRSGFSGIAAGNRYDSQDSVDTGSPWKATFSDRGKMGMWWSASPVNERFGTVYGLSFCVEDLMQYRSFYKTCGYSVRLVKDEQ